MLLSEEGVVLDALDAKGRTAAAVARDRGHNQVGPSNDPFLESEDMIHHQSLIMDGADMGVLSLLSGA